MATRTFTAPDGTVWQAWNVVPDEHLDWPEHARRHLPETLAGGWLCFESPAEKRRLQPIPAEWESGDESQLWSFCLSADPVRRRLAPAPVVGAEA